MINKLFQTIITLGKVVLKSNYFISFDKSVDQSVIVLGNGPSLKNDILNNLDIFERSSLAVVNHFCHSEFFFQLKPKSYFLLDPAFFVNADSLESVKKTFQILTKEVDWNIVFYIPNENRKSVFAQELKKIKQFQVHFVNYVPAKGGFQWVNHLLFDLNLAMPQCQNVLIYALFIIAKKGTEQIFLFGAENDWHANVKVNKENFLVLYDSHLYEEEKSATEKILYTSSDKSKKTTMVDLLESSVKVFKGYGVIRNYAQKKKVRIYNCSKNSLIDTFERLDDQEFRKLY